MGVKAYAPRPYSNCRRCYHLLLVRHGFACAVQIRHLHIVYGILLPYNIVVVGRRRFITLRMLITFLFIRWPQRNCEEKCKEKKKCEAVFASNTRDAVDINATEPQMS